MLYSPFKSCDTYFNKQIEPPKQLELNGARVEVVSTFKLLGVTLDNKLKVDKFTSEVRNKIVQKMHSIKKLFQLSTSVKMEFFKSFMMPYFDYCSTLAIYYAKTAIQRMCNRFNLCLFKLFKMKNTVKTNEELNEHNNKLEKFGLKLRPNTSLCSKALRLSVLLSTS